MSNHRGCPCIRDNFENTKLIPQARICATSFSRSSSHQLKDIIDNHQSQFHLDRLSAAFITSKLWKPNSEIKIGFLSSGEDVSKTPPRTFSKDIDPLTQFVYDNKPIESIKKIVLERYQPLVNLKFTFVDDPSDADVRIDFKENDGAWSLLGTDCLNEKGTTMNLGWVDCPTILHEFGHTLGLFHEHQNPRGSSINWDKETVYKWAKDTQGWDKETTDTNIFNHYDLNLTNGSVYDPLSIMLYFFPDYLTKNNKGTRINSRLSATDVLWINKVYGKGAEMTAEEFYPKVYGMSLKDGLEMSKKAGATFGNEPIETYENYKKSSKHSVSDIVWFCLLALFFVGVIVFLEYLNKKTNILC